MIASQFSHRGLKTHVEHAIGFIKNEVLALFKANPILGHKILQATRSTNQNIASRRSFLKRKNSIKIRKKIAKNELIVVLFKNFSR